MENKISILNCFKVIGLSIMCVCTLGFVGYASIDKEAPVVGVDELEVLYGTQLDETMFAITDNVATLKTMTVTIDTNNYDPYTLGKQEVKIKVVDSAENSVEKTVAVVVVDKDAPLLAAINAIKDQNVEEIEEVYVEVNSDSNIKNYIKAVDEVDADVSSSIESDVLLDTSVIGSQIINVKAKDHSNNVVEKTFNFIVGDSQAPKISFNSSNSISINYKSNFNYQNYVTITDNFDKDSLNIKVEGTVDTSVIGTYNLKIIASDQANNVSEATLQVAVKDLEAPLLKLSKSSVSITKGKSFDPKAYLSGANDNKDGNLKSKVSISNPVNINKVGTYYVKYSVKDEAGNVASQTLTVYVKNPVVSNSSLASIALSKVGSAYVYGATGPNAFDCSGLVVWSYKQIGKYNIPRTAAQQYYASTPVSRSNLKVGDLVFFKNTVGTGITHVGIYIGNNKFVHAANKNTGVIISSLSETYWSNHFYSFGRI